jgi:hypothetical protein
MNNEKLNQIINNILKIINIVVWIKNLLGIDTLNVYKFLYTKVYKWIEKIDFENDLAEEYVEDFLETLTDIILRFALGIPFDEKIDLPEIKR